MVTEGRLGGDDGLDALFDAAGVLGGQLTGGDAEREGQPWRLATTLATMGMV